MVLEARLLPVRSASVGFQAVLLKGVEMPASSTLGVGSIFELFGLFH